MALYLEPSGYGRAITIGAGGVDLYGRGASGEAGISSSSAGGELYAGQGGSGGAVGEYRTSYGVGTTGGQYGSGAWGLPQFITGTSRSGVQGAVRIISGTGRNFPLDASYQTPSTGNSSYTTTITTGIVIDTPIFGEITISTTTFLEE